MRESITHVWQTTLIERLSRSSFCTKRGSNRNTTAKLKALRIKRVRRITKAHSLDLTATQIKALATLTAQNICNQVALVVLGVHCQKRIALTHTLSIHFCLLVHQAHRLQH